MDSRKIVPCPDCLAHLAQAAGEFDEASAKRVWTHDTAGIVPSDWGDMLNSEIFALGARWQHQQSSAREAALRANLADNVQWRVNLADELTFANSEIARLRAEVVSFEEACDVMWPEWRTAPLGKALGRACKEGGK